MNFYIAEDRGFYYEGQILSHYDTHGNFLEFVKINKFIKHKGYLAVNFQSLEYKTKNWTLNVDCLGTLYRNEKGK